MVFPVAMYGCSLSLLQGIFPTKGLNPSLPHCRWIPYQLSHKGSPRILEWVTYLFSSGSSWPRNQTRVSCIAGRFFTNWAIGEALWLVVNAYHQFGYCRLKSDAQLNCIKICSVDSISSLHQHCISAGLTVIMDCVAFVISWSLGLRFTTEKNSHCDLFQHSALVLLMAAGWERNPNADC